MGFETEDNWKHNRFSYNFRISTRKTLSHSKLQHENESQLIEDKQQDVRENEANFKGKLWALQEKEAAIIHYGEKVYNSVTPCALDQKNADNNKQNFFKNRTNENLSNQIIKQYDELFNANKNT